DEWAEANLRSMKGVLDPVSDRLGDGLGPLSGIVGTGLGVLLAAEAGALSGFLAGRVLGQYEFPVLDPEAPALGRPARVDARAAVRRRAVAARPPRRLRARAAGRHDLRGRQPAEDPRS